MPTPTNPLKPSLLANFKALFRLASPTPPVRTSIVSRLNHLRIRTLRRFQRDPQPRSNQGEYRPLPSHPPVEPSGHHCGIPPGLPHISSPLALNSFHLRPRPVVDYGRPEIGGPPYKVKVTRHACERSDVCESVGTGNGVGRETKENVDRLER